MAEAIAPPQDQLAPVAPSDSGKMQETVVPANPSMGDRGVAQVTVNYPPELQTVANHVANPNTPEARTQLAATVDKVTNDTASFPRNVQPQWGAVFANLLMRNYVGALNAYNGGQTRDEEALSVEGKQYTKEYNQRGFTGQIRDSSGRVLSQKEVNDLYSRGGLISQSDQRALQTSTWGNQSYMQSQIGGGLVNKFVQIQNNAYTAANSASASNNNAMEQIKLIKDGGIQGALDRIASLPAPQRAALLAAIQRYNTISKGATGAQTSGTSATGSFNRNANIGGEVGGRGGVGGGANQGGGGAGVNVGGSAGTSAGTQSTGTSSARTTAEQTSGTSTQDVQNLQSTIMAQMAMTLNPEQFNNLMRYQALDAINKQNFEQIPVDARPPGFQEVPEFDPNMTGSQSAIQNRVIQMKNNALTAAWTKFLYQNSRDILKNGGTIADVNMSDLQDKFQKSEVFQGINNKFNAALEYHKTGQQPQFAPGTILVNENNKVIRIK